VAVLCERGRVKWYSERPMSGSDDDPRELTLDELTDFSAMQPEEMSGQRPRGARREDRANPFRDAPTMPSQRIRADTLANLPVPEVAEPSNEPAALRLRDALWRHGADLSKVAEELDISVGEIYQQAHQLGIRLSDYT